MEIERGEKKMRKEFDGGTGRNDEHTGVNVTKRVTNLSKNIIRLSSTFVHFIK